MPIEILPGQVINNYRIVRRLGAGGMGTVFEVVHVQIGRRAAIKILALDAQTHPEFVSRFLNEARAVNQVRHSGVLQVFEYGSLADGTPWMLMELLIGHTLSERLEALSRLPLDTALLILQQLAEILTSIHSHGIIHRDLKPSNIMLVQDRLVRGGERVKLLDFGIAKLVDAGLRSSGQPGDVRTESGVILGTVHYMAPEQVKAASTVDGRADVYAFGVIAYQALSGQFPIYDSEAWALLVKKVTQPALPLRQRAPDLPVDICDLVMATLEREPQHRPGMATVEDALSRMLGQRASIPAIPSFAVISPVAAIPPVPPPVPPPASIPAPIKLPLLVASTLSPPLLVVPAEVASSAGPGSLVASGGSAGFESRRRWVFALGSIALLCSVFAVGKHLFVGRGGYPIVHGDGDGAGAADLAQSDLRKSPADLSADLSPVALHSRPVPSNGLSAEPPPPPLKQGALSHPPPARAASTCVAVAVTEACVHGKSIPSETRAKILAALRESRIKLCVGDSIAFSLGPSGPRLSDVPARLSSIVVEDLLLIMRGYLDNQSQVSQVEVQCRTR